MTATLPMLTQAQLLQGAASSRPALMYSQAMTLCEHFSKMRSPKWTRCSRAHGPHQITQSSETHSSVCSACFLGMQAVVWAVRLPLVLANQRWHQDLAMPQVSHFIQESMAHCSNCLGLVMQVLDLG